MQQVKVYSKIKYITFFLLLFTTLLCNAQKPSHLTSLKTKDDFDLIKGEPLSDYFKGIECVKIVYVLATKKLYYLESVKYRFHYRFCIEKLGETDELEDFNQKNYGQHEERKYVLATLNYNITSKKYFLQFSIADNPSDDQINEICAVVKETIFLKDDFKILLNSTTLLSRKNSIEKLHKIITSDELFRNQKYQPICKGKATGILQFVDADSMDLNKDYSLCILIMKGSSNEIPVCKGIITTEFQTPLSHICLLTNNRKTPAAALKNILKYDSLRKFENKMVEISVSNERVSIKPSQNNKLLSGKKQNKIKLLADTVNTLIADLNGLSYKNKITYGSKASNLAELKKAGIKNGKINTPAAAFAVPFSAYAQHLKKSGTIQLIEKLLGDSLALKNDSLTDHYLKQIRNKIKNFKLDTAFLKLLNEKCVRYFGKNKIRFRSSSNCEDEANFNGAGLYTSQTGLANDTIKSIEKAVKKVWASLWSVRAFRERSFFNIDHNSVYMAVLVHAAFDNEYANGVAITKNLYRNSLFGFVINLQKGEEEVVSPKPDVTCEQLISYMNTWETFYNENRSADWISFSSFHSNGSLLSADELFELTKDLEIIKQHFYKVLQLNGKKDYKDFSMDVEFKIIEGPDKKRKIVFKQARPYNG